MERYFKLTCEKNLLKIGDWEKWNIENYGSSIDKDGEKRNDRDDREKLWWTKEFYRKFIENIIRMKKFCWFLRKTNNCLKWFEIELD